MIILLLSLIGWGWLNDNWIVTGGILILILASLLTGWRWALKVEQFYRVGDFVLVLFITALLYFAVADIGQQPVFIILEWLPVFFLPVLLVQLYNVNDQLPLGILFYSVRKREHQATLDFKLPFAAICWLGAGAANGASLSYFALSCLGFITILWTVRSKNSPVIIWIGVIVLATGLSLQGQDKLRILHSLISNQAVEWMLEWQTDPFKSMTSIGDIGSLKLSDRIEFRAKAEEPLLLMQASYDRYIGQSWLATLRVFNEEPNYSPAEKQVELKHLEIFQALKRTTILALPAGTVNITGLEGATLHYSPLGAVKLTEAPGFINYQIDYTGLQVNEVHEFDLQIPPQHQAWIATIKQDLKLERHTPTAIYQAIEQYFQEHYYYSLFLGKESNPDKALIDFILRRKAGHCEYFAVASVFLLRSYGIPARLANGYAMREYNASAQMYIVRRRHAHAWAIANINGYWQAVDSTPAQWLDIEEQQAEFLQPVYDFFSGLYFQYKQWRYQQAMTEEHDNGQPIWLMIGGVLLLLLFWRLIVSRRDLVQMENKQQNMPALTYPGQDSALFDIEKALAKTDDARLADESALAWARRIGNLPLIEISKMHTRYRFDEERFTAADRSQLQQTVREWLALYE